MVQSLFAQKEGHNSFYQIDPDLGYSVGKNKSYWGYQSNSYGLKEDKEYSLVPSPKVLRVAVFGDSFVFCDGETNENSWPTMLEKSIGGLEVMNFGVSGYGLSQSYLRYLKDGLQFHPDIVFMNYIVAGLGNRDWFEGNLIGGTDLRRSTLYYPLLSLRDGKVTSSYHFTPLDLFKPKIRNKCLIDPLGLRSFERLLLTPFFSFTNIGLAAKNFYFQNKFNQALQAQYAKAELNNKGLAYSEAITKDLLETAQRQHSFVIYFADQNFDSLPVSIQRILYQHSSHVLYVNGRNIIYTLFAKLKLQRNAYLNSTNHYNALGNRIYADTLAMFLKNTRWGSGDRIFEYCPKSNRFQNTSIEPCQ